MVRAYIGLALVIAIALLTGWPLFSGLRRGVIYVRRVGHSRVDDPSSFWFYVSGYAVAFAASAGLLAYLGVETVLR
jgi:hypothetical protein